LSPNVWFALRWVKAGGMSNDFTNSQRFPNQAPNQKRSSRRAIFIFLLVLMVIAFIVLTLPKKEDADNAAEARRKGGTPLVETTTVTTADVPISLTAIGNVEALETVSIQPQINGQLKSVHFKQGQFVKQGQLLFVIDPRLQQTAVAQSSAMASRSKAAIREAQANVQKSSAQIAAAEANLKRDQAQLSFAQVQEERYRNLLAKNYVTREQYEQLKTSLATAQATVAADQATLANTRAQVLSDRAAIQTSASSALADQASLQSAKIQLGFTQIYSPITGKTGPLLINAGNNLIANSSTLVSIERFSPILVGFSVPEKNLLEVRAAMHQSKNVPVVATIQNEDQGSKLIRETGRLIFIDNTVNANTGTVRLKSEFPNTDHMLWPGRFVNVELDLGVQRNAVVVPVVAIQSGQNGDFVYVVLNNQVQMKSVLVSRIINDRAILARGLSPGEVVVTTGQLKLAPGTKVRIAGASDPGHASGGANAEPSGATPASRATETTTKVMQTERHVETTTGNR
jgi:multidrug efflux system membrane fusion protein